MSPALKRLLLLICFSFVVACGKDGAQNPEPIQIQPDLPDTAIADAGRDTSAPLPGDTSVGEDATSRPDAAGPPDVEDVGSEDAIDANDVIEDVGSDTNVDGDTHDAAGSEPFVDPYEGRPKGQCTVNADCPEGPQGKICNRQLPGGACTACSPGGQGCPADTFCSEFGTCVMDCVTTDDCAPGLRCLGSGQCAAMPCVNGACPVPLFGCNASNLCTRTACNVEADCPEQTTCLSGLCIEERALRN
jgi:hypothetical protein